MRTLIRLTMKRSLLVIALAFAGCAQYATVKDRQFNRTKCQRIRLSRFDATEPTGRNMDCIGALWQIGQRYHR